MIRRDRNRASLVMCSLGNEIVFMGMAAVRQGPAEEAGRAGAVMPGRSIRTHPLTFEADLDPDGAYDVIGLHYPHEMPQQRDYPNTTDWLGRRKERPRRPAACSGSRASGGFFWERKKPLYIGEYLWVPQQDYSVRHDLVWRRGDAESRRSITTWRSSRRGMTRRIALSAGGRVGDVPVDGV